MDLKKISENLKRFLTETQEKSPIQKGEMYFVLIGIDRYSHLNNLNFCKSESESILNLWKSQSKSDIKRKNIYKLYDFDATKINILSLFNNLSKTISFNDKIIIHIAGHEFADYNAKFFVPTDGNKNNIYSCLSSSTINHYIRDIKCSNILMIGNTFDSSAGKNKKRYWESILGGVNSTDFEVSTRKNTIYNSLLTFLSTNEQNRNKEIFFVSREKQRNETTEEQGFTYWQHDDKELQSKVKAQHIYLKQLIMEGQTEKALSLIREIVKNNDIQLKSQVETLQYKYGQIKYIPSKSIKREEVLNSESEILNLSKGLVKKINDHGFYLIHLPQHQNKKLLIEKNRNIILFTSADPSDQSRLRLDDEYRNIEFELMRSKNRDDYELVPCLATRISDFQKKLLDLKPKFIHFSGHGSCQGICLINNDEGETRVIENAPLSELFRLFSKYIKCVFLNSCHSVNQSKPIGKFIENVICMNSSVDDKTAIHFASAFYASLASGEDINFSFEFARNSIDLNKLSGSDIPQLITNSN